MVDIRKFFNHKEFIQETMEKGNVWIAGFIGFMGFFSSDIVSMFFRYSSGNTLPNEFQRLFTKGFLLSFAVMFGTISLMYLTGRILKGNCRFRQFLTAMGWAGVY